MELVNHLLFFYVIGALLTFAIVVCEIKEADRIIGWTFLWPVLAMIKLIKACLRTLWNELWN